MTFHNIYDKPLQLPLLRIHVPKYSAPLGDPLSILKRNTLGQKIEVKKNRIKSIFAKKLICLEMYLHVQIE